jgi:phosphoribosylanthranilate isomerase
MNRPSVKICGLMRREDIRVCIDYGADILGFVVDYPVPVPWNLNVSEASALIDEARAYNGGVPVCVVTGGSVDNIKQIANDLKPDFIQLHGKETPKEAAYLAGELTGVKLIKALSPDMQPLIETAQSYAASGVYAILLDPRSQDDALKSGRVDYRIWREVSERVSCPVILAGGLTPENAAEAVRETGARHIDLMTGVETSPGVKDEAKVRALFRNL